MNKNICGLVVTCGLMSVMMVSMLAMSPKSRRSFVGKEETSSASSLCKGSPCAQIDFEALQERAENGDADAQYHLAVYYLNDIDAAHNKELMVTWLFRAVDQNHIKAVELLRSNLPPGMSLIHQDGQWVIMEEENQENCLSMCSCLCNFLHLDCVYLWRFIICHGSPFLT